MSPTSTHTIFKSQIHRQVVKQGTGPQGSQQALLTLAQAKQPQCFFDSWTDPSDRSDGIVAQNGFFCLRGVKSQKLVTSIAWKSRWKHLRLINGACAVQQLHHRSLNFWLDDVTSTVKKQNCGWKSNAPRLCSNYSTRRLKLASEKMSDVPTITDFMIKAFIITFVHEKKH